MTAQEYLEAKLGEMASQDPNFRERYEDEQKSMNDCIRYITQQAQNKPLTVVQQYRMMKYYKWQSTTIRRRTLTPQRITRQEQR